MDAACYNSTDGFIYGVRGGRVFQCNASTGAVTAFTDYSTTILSGASICYAAVNNTLWAGGWNNQGFNHANGNAIPAAFFFKPCSLYKLTPGAPPTVAQVVDLDTAFAADAPWNSAQQPLAGVSELKYIGTSVYATIAQFQLHSGLVPVKFDPTNLASFILGFASAVGVGPFAWQTGDFIWAPDVTFPRLTQVDMSTGAFANELDTWSGGSPATVHDFFPVAVEFSNETGALFVTSQDVGSPGDGSWIYRCSTAPAEVLRFNTGRTNFNGVHIKRNPNTGLLYAAGLGDNTVIEINPVGNTFTVKTGFDLPWDFVFTPTKKWCVQQGSTGLKEIV